MAEIYSAIYSDSNYWDGTTAWGYSPTSSDRWNPTENADQTARDAAYTASYTSLSAWITGRAASSQAGDNEYAVIQGPWTSSDTTGVTISGFSSDECRVFALGVARAGSAWDTTDAYTLESNTTTSWEMRMDHDGYIDGIQISNSSTGGTDCLILNDGPTVDIYNCFLKPVGNMRGLRDSGSTGATARIWSTIIINTGTQGSGEGILGDLAASAFTVYNTTVYNMNDGFERDGGTFTVANCISGNNFDDFDGSFTSITNCCSDDGDGTNAQNPLSSSWANELTNTSTGDMNLVSGGNCIDNGTDNPGSGLYSVDIDGVTWTSTWDIGAVQLVSGVSDLSINISDSSTIAENINNSVLELGNISLSELITTTENITGNMPLGNIAIAETINTNESLSENNQLPSVLVSELISILENVSTTALDIAVSVFDGISANEDIAAQIESAGASVSDVVTLIENLQASTLNLGNVSVNELINITENIQAVFNIAASITDEITIAEYVIADISSIVNLQASVFDAVSVLESVSTSILDLAGVSISENVSLSEAITAITDYLISVSDSVAVSENIEIYTDLFTAISDSITIAENVTVLVAEVTDLTVSISDAISLGENITALLRALTTPLDRVFVIGKDDRVFVIKKDDRNFII